MVFREQAGKGDVTAIDSRVKELRTEMATLVKLNLTARIDSEIYNEEYRRITGEIDELRRAGPELPGRKWHGKKRAAGFGK